MIYIENIKPSINLKFYILTIKETLRDYDIECEDFKMEIKGEWLCFNKKDFELFKLYIYIINHKEEINNNIWLHFIFEYQKNGEYCYNTLLTESFLEYYMPIESIKKEDEYFIGNYQDA